MGIGNAWHIPRNPEPPGRPGMRFPLHAIEPDTPVTLISGNQFQGAGVAGNQTRSGSLVMIRKAGDAAFTPLTMQFDSAAANNKYFFALVPSNNFRSGDLVQYYFKIDYTDRDTTFVHGSDGNSKATANEAEAQADPFTFAVRFPLNGSGPALTFDSGALQGRIFQDSGHIALAGSGQVIMLAPPVVAAGDRSCNIGRVISSAPLPNGLDLVQQLGLKQVRTRLTFPLDGILRYEVIDWQGIVADQVSFAAASDASEHFFGFGEKFNALDQAGKSVEILTFDNPANKGDRSYKVAPWFVSNKGYGLHLDSTARGVFDMRASNPDRFTVTNFDGRLKVNLVFGPNLTDVVSRYTGMTGRPALPPPWAFGAWISSDIWRSGGEVRYAVTKFREHGIPVSAFVFDSPWEVAYNDFRFNEAQFGPAGNFEGKPFAGFAHTLDMMTFFRENGLKVVCWMTPFVNVSSDSDGVPGQNTGQALNYAAGAIANFFVRESVGGPPLVVKWWKGRGSPVDFTKPAAAAWFTNQLKDLQTASLVITKSGREPAIGGFKTDDGESGNGINTYIPDTAVYSNGKTGHEFVNGYCVEYHKTVFNSLSGPGLLFARSGFTGSQTFPGCWAGDNEPNFGAANGLPSVIVAGLSAAMSGFSIWGHDVGAYQNANFSTVSRADLFIRWTQFGCFSPIMQMHRQVNDANLEQYPWGYPEAGESVDDNRALDNYRFYAGLHQRLFPYIYTHAKISNTTGIPVMRPLALMHQDDPKALAVQHSYYFGADLLIAPVIAPKAARRDLYLPEGDWVDFWTNASHAGKQDITWTNPAQPDPPLSKIPVFVKRGAIIPLILGEAVQTLCDGNYVNNPAISTWDGGLELRIYPKGSTQTSIFDGTVVQCDATHASPTIAITSPTARPILLRILAPKPAAVTRDGTAIPAAGSPAGFNAAPAAWLFDPTSGFVLVKFTHSAGATSITL